MWPWQRESESLKLLGRAMDELAEARRDTVRLAEQQQATLDGIVTNRFSRPVTIPREPVESPRPSPITASEEPDPNDDAQWMRNMETQRKQ